MERKTQLRLWIGGALVVASLLAWTSDGRAETIKAKNTTSVYTSQGEKSRVVTRVPGGKTMTVLRKEGRWIKVRVNGLTGWITRSSATTGAAARATTTQNRKVSFVEGRSRKEKLETGPADRVGGDAVKEEGFDEDLSEVDESSDGKPNAAEEDEDEAAPPPRKVAAREKKARKKRKKPARDEEESFGDDEGESERDDAESEPDSDESAEDTSESSDEEESSGSDTVVVVTDIKLRSKPSKKSKSVEKVAAGDELSVIERDGDWIKVSTAEGEEGWVKAEDVGEQGAYSYKKVGIVANAGLAYRAVGQAFSSTSTDPLGNYSISSGTAMLAVGGDLIYDYSRKYLLGGDLGLGYTSTTPGPGIRFNDPEGGMPADIGFSILQVDLGGRAGYKISERSGLAGYVRLGYHYERFSVKNTTDFESNTARLPSEILQGATIGLLFELPRFYTKYSARVGLDYLSSSTLGKRTQTSGLEDGELSKVSALWATARGTYQWKERMQLSGTYQYASCKTDFDGLPAESQRRHIEGTAADGYEAARKDRIHTFMIGLTRAF